MSMNKEVGSKSFPIWLLGDSNPKNWAEILKTPLDPRHPARHNIWTPVLEVIQDKVYRQARLRMDTSNLFIRNAIEDPNLKPLGNNDSWPQPVLEEIEEMKSYIDRFKPVFFLCFGAFSYEFGRRILGETPEYSHNQWGAEKLGEEFRKRVQHFNCNQTNLFPLLHISISGGKFIQSHQYFCENKSDENYFEYVGNQLADVMLAHKDELNIWIK